ncbi:tetratricopeptide repeat protein [Streptomyces sp. NPDC002889]|uniref:tetratricopeptide repeat protein n=1 Tax=Streptomyces sp. NPDC002889 TaxID=3364669 RepID=UPI0036B144BC
MNSQTLKKAAISTLIGATLVTGVILIGPGWGNDSGPAPAPGPASRAMAAVGAGAPASLSDLAALIADRERWLRKSPRDDESWAVLGAAYAERGTRLADSSYYPSAERALQHSLELLPAAEGNVDALIGQAALANARHDFTKARGLGERAVELKPNLWRAYPELIDAYNGLGEYKAAIKAMDRLQKLRKDPGMQGLEAHVYRERGWREDAAAAAHDAAASAESPVEKAAALHLLGELAWEQGEPAEAERQYTAALRVSAESHRSLAGRARALAAQGRTAEAMRDYQAALAKVPLPEHILELGELYESQGLDGDATTQYDRLREHVAEAAAHGVDNELVLARFEADHGAPAAAVRRLQDEWRRGHRSADVADAMGWALYKAGRPSDALPFARRATQPELHSALFTYHRGQIERTLQNYGAARRNLEEALRINPQFSPLFAPLAQEALADVGQPPAGGPRDMTGEETGGGTGEEREETEEGARSGADTGSRSGTESPETATPSPAPPSTAPTRSATTEPEERARASEEPAEPSASGGSTPRTATAGTADRPPSGQPARLASRPADEPASWTSLSVPSGVT